MVKAPIERVRYFLLWNMQNTEVMDWNLGAGNWPPACQRGSTQKKPRIVATRWEKQILWAVKLRKPQRFSKRSWKTFQMKKRKTSLTENQTFEKGKFWETGLLLPKLSPLPQGAWRTGKRQRKRRNFVVAANSTALRPETRRQGEAPCSGTTGRGTLQRLKTLGLECQEAPVENLRKNLGQLWPGLTCRDH